MPVEKQPTSVNVLNILFLFSFCTWLHLSSN
jgi:hypothetical protein